MTYFTSILEQALLYGLFHADPHPANIFVNKKGKLIYLDYGIMGELDADDRRKIINFIESIPEKNADKSLDIIISLARDTSKGDIPAFKQETLGILREIYNSPIAKKSYAHAFYEIISTGAKHGIIFDPNHMLVAKAFYQAEGIGLKLYPEFKVLDGLKVFMDKYLKQKYSPAQIIGKVRKTFLANHELILDLPEHIAKIIKRLESPAPQQQLNVTQLEEFEEELNYLNRRRNIGLIISALIIASAVLFYLEGRTSLLGMPISILLFVFALILLIYFLFFSRKKGG
jgi:ubiquinone biosynthesis protein